MYWCKQLFKILKRNQRSEKKIKKDKSSEENKLLGNGISSSNITQGSIRQSKSVDTLAAPNVPMRSTSQVPLVQNQVPNQVWVPAIQAIPIMFTNGQVMMGTGQDLNPNHNFPQNTNSIQQNQVYFNVNRFIKRH